MFVYVFIALSALLTAQAMAVFEWNSNTVDNILLQGDSKYQNSAFESGLVPRGRYYFILLMREAAKIVLCNISFGETNSKVSALTFSALLGSLGS